jgi:hypothetical protein
MKAYQKYWSAYPQLRQHVGSPLCPAPVDVGLIEEVVRHVSQTTNGGPLHALLLGVTPELARMSWPQETRLIALDRSLEMVQMVWPRAYLSLPAIAVRSEWRALPIPDAKIQVVIGDGCYSQLESAEGYHEVSAEVCRVLRSEGHFAMRFFVRPDPAESSAHVFADLASGLIGNFHILKLRLAMALDDQVDVGVRLGDIWEAWNAERLDAETLSQRLNWPRAAISTIDAYRGLETRYTFPTLKELRARLSDHFVELACHIPAYELGERCPTLLMAPRN